jgi:hypothetical protein
VDRAQASPLAKPTSGDELYNIDRKPKAHGLAALPSTYDKVKLPTPASLSWITSANGSARKALNWRSTKRPSSSMSSAIPLCL